jgi:toxin ParE1/3/4
MKVVWTESAERDLETIESYVARDNPNAAAALVDRLVGRAEAVAEHPHLGRVVPEIGAEHVRELIEGNYRIVYRLRGRRAEILTVFEGHSLLRGIR